MGERSVQLLSFIVKHLTGRSDGGGIVAAACKTSDCISLTLLSSFFGTGNSSRTATAILTGRS